MEDRPKDDMSHEDDSITPRILFAVGVLLLAFLGGIFLLVIWVLIKFIIY